MLICFFVLNFIPKFKLMGLAILFTILINQLAIYSTQASGLWTNSQTG